jgi:hypothetical protein
MVPPWPHYLTVGPITPGNELLAHEPLGTHSNHIHNAGSHTVFQFVHFPVKAKKWTQVSSTPLVPFTWGNPINWMQVHHEAEDASFPGMCPGVTQYWIWQLKYLPRCFDLVGWVCLLLLVLLISLFNLCKSWLLLSSICLAAEVTFNPDYQSRYLVYLSSVHLFHKPKLH